MAHRVKESPAVQETGVRSLGQEDPLEKGMATHSTIPAWRIPQREEPGCSPWGCKELDTANTLTEQSNIYVYNVMYTNVCDTLSIKQLFFDSMIRGYQCLFILSSFPCIPLNLIRVLLT